MSYPLVVSITSLPSRIGKMRPTLESLLSGSLVPDEILVALPHTSVRERSEYRLPDFLQDQDFCRGVVKVVAADRDWGPGTKLLGCLTALRGPCHLVIADDDVRYEPDFLRRLRDAHASDHNSSFSYYTYRTHGLTVGQGCDGFSFWSPNLHGVRSFAEQYVADTKVMFHDDLWISFYLMSVGVKIRSLHDTLGGARVYEQVHETNALRYLSGDLAREALDREGVERLLAEVPVALPSRLRVRATAYYDRYVLKSLERASRLLSRKF